jgi:hypothetical protein
LPARYWPRTTSRATLSGVKGFSDFSTLSFSSRMRVGVAGGRRLHRDHRQQLQRMVLHHVAQRTGAVVEVAARAHADGLGQRDLDVGDALAPPQRFEQRVAEAQRRQVLHRRLAQVVVDAVGLLLGKGRATTRLISCALARSCPSGFSSTTRTRGPFSPPAPSCAQITGNRCGLVARNSTCVSALRASSHASARHSRPAATGPCGGSAAVRQSARTPRTGPLGRIDILEALADEVAVLVIAALVARHRQDAPALGQLAVAEGLEQRRHQLAPGQVAGAAEEDEVEGHRCAGDSRM